MNDWNMWFKNPHTNQMDYLSLSGKLSKNKAKEEFNCVFPGIVIIKMNRMDIFLAEEKLKQIKTHEK